MGEGGPRPSPSPGLGLGLLDLTGWCCVTRRDNYWVINGLLLSEMTDTALGMIQNFVYLVDR